MGTKIIYEESVIQQKIPDLSCVSNKDEVDVHYHSHSQTAVVIEVKDQCLFNNIPVTRTRTTRYTHFKENEASALYRLHKKHSRGSAGEMYNFYIWCI